MCRVEVKIYINADGHRSKFEEQFPCDKARKGFLCANAKQKTTEYWPKKRPATRDDGESPPTSPTDTGPYIVEQRRHPSSATTIIEYGNKQRRNTEYYPDLIRAIKGDSSYDADGEDHHYLADRSTSSHGSSYGTSSPSQLRERQQQQENREEKEENIKQVRFELSRVGSSRERRAESRLAESEKQRAIDREDARRHKQREREEEVRWLEERGRAKAKRAIKSSREAATMTSAQKEEQRRLLSAELDHMQVENEAAEARKREETTATLRRQQQDTSYYNPRVSDISNASNRTLARQATRVMDRSSGMESDDEVTHGRSRRTPFVEQVKVSTATGPHGQPPSAPGVHSSFDANDGSKSPNVSISNIETSELRATSSAHFVKEESNASFSVDDGLHPDSVVALRELEWDHIFHGNRRPFVPSDSGSSISYANSVFSTASLASSATDISKHSGYSAIQIAKATKELIIILQEDPTLAALYKRAIADGSIGSGKLKRNLRRLFRNYADLLEKAAGETLQLLAARLVKAKARAVAQSIIQKYSTDLVSFESNKVDPKPEDDREQSSDEELNPYPINEDAFEDLVIFREFLVGGEPFAVLRTQVRSFILPKSKRQETIEEATIDNKLAKELMETNTSTSRDAKNPLSESATCSKADEQHEKMIMTSTAPCGLYRFAIKTLKQSISSTCISLRYLEPPLREGFTRLRWQCVRRATKA
jgi:hypothetical protein